MNNGTVNGLTQTKVLDLLQVKMAMMYLHIFQLFNQMDLKL